MKKHCENCNCKKQEWIQDQLLNLEFSSIPTQISSEKDIKIPKGMRLASYAEYARWIEQRWIPFNEEWVEYCTQQNTVVAVWLYIYADWFYLDCDNLPIGYAGRSRGVRSRGVRFVREVKK